MSFSVCVDVHVQKRDVQLPRCPLPHKLTSAVQSRQPVSSERHPRLLQRPHIWTGLAHSSSYTNVGNKSSVIECASVQLFSFSDSPLIVLAQTTRTPECWSQRNGKELLRTTLDFLLHDSFPTTPQTYECSSKCTDWFLRPLCQDHASWRACLIWIQFKESI